ncbi:MAG: hypothetical protein IJL10_00595, partial [Synergistaceae bacterium]|nr:hypothetical protein [Synergistaceae bacterium]
MRKIFAAVALVLMFTGVSFADPVDDLLGYNVSRFGVERGEIIVDALPDETGRFTDIYMSLKGLVIEDLRIDNVTVRMKGVQFNEPSNWKDGNVECKDAISIQG